ncbi:DUF533 domain-containing protein [Gymnodinialimonas sp.]
MSNPFSYLITNVQGFFQGRQERRDLEAMGVADQWSTFDMPKPDADACPQTKRAFRGGNQTLESAQQGRAIFRLIAEPGRTVALAGGVGAALAQTRQHALGYYEVFKTELRLTAAALAAHADDALTEAERAAILSDLPEDAPADLRAHLTAQLEDPPTLKAFLKRVPRNDKAFTQEVFDISAAVIGEAPNAAETAYLDQLARGLRLPAPQTTAARSVRAEGEIARRG